MKYSVLVALLGSSQARHHNHHRLAQLTTPDESRKAWDETRNTSWAVVAEQQRFQAEHNAMVAKNFDDDTAATDAKKNHVRKAYINTLNGSNSFAQISDPLGKANEAFVKGKAEAEAVVAGQQALEGDQTSMVKNNFDKDTANTQALKSHVSDGYVHTLNGSNGYLPPVKGSSFVQLEGVEPAYPLGNANDSLVKNKPLEAKVVADQQSFESWKEADVDSRNEANKAASASLRGHVTRARDTQAQGDFWHEPYPYRDLWAGRPDATFLQMGKPAKDPLGAQNASHTKGVAEAEEVVSTQNTEEADALATHEADKDKYKAQASAERKYGNGYVDYQAAGGYTHDSYPRAPFTHAYMMEEPAEEKKEAPAKKAAKPAEEEKKAPSKEGDVTPVEKEAQPKTPAGPKDPQGWAHQTKAEGLSVSDEVVKKQQAAEAEVEKTNKENDDEYSAKADAKRVSITAEYDRQAQGGIRHEVYPQTGWHYDSKNKVPSELGANYAYMQVRDNEADVSFTAGKAVAADVVAKQQAFEKAKTADVEARNDANSKECSDLRKHVVTTHEERLKQFDPHVQMVYIPEQEIYLGLY